MCRFCVSTKEIYITEVIVRYTFFPVCEKAHDSCNTSGNLYSYICGKNIYRYQQTLFNRVNRYTVMHIPIQQQWIVKWFINFKGEELLLMTLSGSMRVEVTSGHPAAGDMTRATSSVTSPVLPLSLCISYFSVFSLSPFKLHIFLYLLPTLSFSILF